MPDDWTSPGGGQTSRAADGSPRFFHGAFLSNTQLQRRWQWLRPVDPQEGVKGRAAPAAPPSSLALPRKKLRRPAITGAALVEHGYQLIFLSQEIALESATWERIRIAQLGDIGRPHTYVGQKRAAMMQQKLMTNTDRGTRRHKGGRIGQKGAQWRKKLHAELQKSNILYVVID